MAALQLFVIQPTSAPVSAFGGQRDLSQLLAIVRLQESTATSRLGLIHQQHERLANHCAGACPPTMTLVPLPSMYAANLFFQTKA